MTDRRLSAKARRKAHRRQRRERLERDARVVAEHGPYAHWSCGRKLRYRSEPVALDHAARYRALGSPPLTAYPCPLCGGWHLTHVTDADGRGE